MLAEVVCSTRYNGPVAIVQVQGSLTLGPGLRRLKPRVDAALSTRSVTAVVLNLGGVEDIDSSGVGELVAVYSSAQRRGSGLVLASVPSKLQQMFAKTRLDAVFSVCADDAAALAQLGHPEIAG